MKNTMIYSLILLVAVFFACEPLELRDEIGGAITADQLQVSATPVVVNGKQSNKIVLVNNSPVNSLWNYGLGTTLRAADTVLMVVTGNTVIKFTGLNPDGSLVSKELTVTVDELTFPVPAEWGQLCGTGAKDWIWDETAGAVWGNGGYKGNSSPGWWTNDKASMDTNDPDYGSEGFMTFSLDGSSLTKSTADGSKKMVGTFSFDMTKQTKDDAGAVWAKGKLTTKNVTVLCGKSPNEGNAPVYSYDILKLDNEKLVLSYPEPGVGSWGTAWFWMFRAK